MPFQILLAVGLFCCFTVSAEDLCQQADLALKQAESIRGLKSKYAVRCIVQNKTQISDFIRESIEKKITPEKLKYEELVYKRVGLIPKTYDYKQGVIDLYLSQIAGYYDPDADHFVMAAWMPLILQEPIAVHELVHALQDQHFQLDTFIDPQKLTTDQALARSALVEGDASLVMYDHMFKKLGGDSLVERDSVADLILQSLAGSASMEGFKDAPKSLQDFLLFPYTAGLRFSHYFLKGSAYSSLNELYHRPPASTKEILHPELYEQGYVAHSFAEGDLRSFFNLDKEQIVYQDTLGEFAITTVLEDSELSQNWQGDYLGLIANTVYWLSLWKDPRSAGKFAKAFSGKVAVQKTMVKGNLVGVVIE